MGSSASAPECTFSCADGQVHDGTGCRAEQSFDCAPGEVHDGTACRAEQSFECETGEVHDGAGCRAEQSFDCAPGTFHDGRGCVSACPAGLFLAEGGCRPLCAADEVWSNGRCQPTSCGAGALWDGAQCVRAADLRGCGEGEAFDLGEGRCVRGLCPAGQTYVDGACTALSDLPDDTPLCEGANSYLDTSTMTCKTLIEPLDGLPASVTPEQVVDMYKCTTNGGVYAKRRPGDADFACDCAPDGSDVRTFNPMTNACEVRCSPNEVLGEDGRCESKFAFELAGKGHGGYADDKPRWLRLCGSQPDAENLATVVAPAEGGVGLRYTGEGGEAVDVALQPEGGGAAGAPLRVAGLSGVRFRARANGDLAFAEGAGEAELGMTVSRAAQMCDLMHRKHLEDPSASPPCFGVSAVAERTAAADLGAEGGAPLKYCVRGDQYAVGTGRPTMTQAMKDAWEAAKLALPDGTRVHTRASFEEAKRAALAQADADAAADANADADADADGGVGAFGPIPGTERPDGCSAACHGGAFVWEERIHKAGPDGQPLAELELIDPSNADEAGNALAARAEADGFTAMCGLRFEYRPITRNGGADGDLLSRRVASEGGVFAHSIVRASPSELLKSNNPPADLAVGSCVDMAKQRNVAWAVELDVDARTGNLRPDLAQDANMCFVSRCEAADPETCYRRDEDTGRVLIDPGNNRPTQQVGDHVNLRDEEAAGLLFQYEPSVEGGGTCVNSDRTRRDVHSSEWVDVVGGECVVSPYHRNGAALRDDVAKDMTRLRPDAKVVPHRALLCGEAGRGGLVDLTHAVTKAHVEEACG